jgi:hypothetical protein
MIRSTSSGCAAAAKGAPAGFQRQVAAGDAGRRQVAVADAGALDDPFVG